MKKLFILNSILLSIIFLAGCSRYQIVQKQPTKQTKDSSEHRTFTYGTISDYLTGQESITYPLIFDNINIEINKQNEKYPSIVFGPQKLENFEISIVASKIPKEGADGIKAELLSRNYTSEGSKNTPNGYTGELLSLDFKQHPKTDTQNCELVYDYFIPLTNSSNDLELSVIASQPEWDTAKSDCKIFEDQNYQYLKTMMDHVIDNIQPAF